MELTHLRMDNTRLVKMARGVLVSQGRGGMTACRKVVIDRTDLTRKLKRRINT